MGVTALWQQLDILIPSARVFSTQKGLLGSLSYTHVLIELRSFERSVGPEKNVAKLTYYRGAPVNLKNFTPNSLQQAEIM